MSYTNQGDYDAGLTSQNKLGGQNFSSVDKNDTLGTDAATRSYGGPDEMSNTTYSSNGNRFNDESNPDKDRLDNRTSRRDDADELSDPSYSSNADRFDNSRSTVSGGAHFGSSGDPNTFSTSNTGTGNRDRDDVTDRSGDRDRNTLSSTGNTYGSGNQQSGNYGNNDRDRNQDRDLNTSTGNTYGSGNQSGNYGSNDRDRNQDRDLDTSTGNTYGSGNQQSGNYGSNDRDLNTSTGNTFGLGNRQSSNNSSGTGNRGRGTADDDSGFDNSSDSLRSGGATRKDVNPTVGSDSYGVSGVSSSGKRYDDDNADPDTDVGGAGTGYGSQRNTSTSDRRGDNAYGNVSSDGGVAGARTDGGANDPAYQPGKRYSYGQSGYVDDTDTSNVGSHNNDVGGAGQGHHGKVGMGDKIKGSLEKVQGKLTKNPDLVQQGEARKTGNLDNDNF